MKKTGLVCKTIKKFKATTNSNHNERISPNLLRGSQYASKENRALLKTHKIQQSMSRKGDCSDNAVAESFFHTLKTELVFHERYKTREQAHASIFEYIEVFYNRKRRHSASGMMSPANFETFRKVA
jgi:transposase InsO family protein